MQTFEVKNRQHVIVRHSLFVFDIQLVRGTFESQKEFVVLMENRRPAAIVTGNRDGGQAFSVPERTGRNEVR